MFEQYLTNIKNALKKQNKYKETITPTKYTMSLRFAFRITDEAIENEKAIEKCLSKIDSTIFPLKVFTTDNIVIWQDQLYYCYGVKGIIFYERVFPFNVIDCIKTTYLKRYIDIYKRYKYLIKYIIDRKKYED